VGVTSTVSFLSLLVWAVVLGPLGALLALPATLFVKALVVDADPRARWVNALIASNPKTSSEEPVLVSEEVARVDPLVPQEVPAADAGTLIPDHPRRSLGDEEPGDEAEVAADEVVPRRSAPEADDEQQVDEVEPLAEDAAPLAEEAEPHVQEAEPLAEEAEPHVQEAEPHVEETEAELPEKEGEALVEEAAPLSEEAEPEDVPRRSRSDEDARVLDDEPIPSDAWPVFQKSATPYWTGPATHAED
jgi:hypothetical protein